MLEDVETVRGDVAEDLGPTAGPADFDAVDLIGGAESEVEPCAEVALVTSAAVDFRDLYAIAGDNSDPRADAVAVGLTTFEPNLDPRAGSGTFA